MSKIHKTRQTWQTPFGAPILAILMTVLVWGSAKAQVSLTATGGTLTGTFTTVSGAFAAINAGTHSGTIAIAINGNTTEPTAPVALLASGGTSFYVSVQIKPTVIATISGATNTGRGLIELDGADNVTIDGAIAIGGTSKDLTIHNSSANTVLNTAAVRLIGRTTLGLGAINNTVKNCMIRGSSQGASGLPLAGVSNSAFGIYAGDNSAIPTFLDGTGIGYNNFVIQNNTIVTARIGIYIAGLNTNLSRDIVIRGNTIGSITNIDADRISDKGILLSGVTSTLVELNEIANIKSGGTSTNNVTGISMSSLGTINFSRAVTISRNKIYGVWQSSTAIAGACGIGMDDTQMCIVINNLIYDIQTINNNNGGVTQQASGIKMNRTSGDKIYYNSVHLYGNYGVIGGISGCSSAALAIDAYTSFIDIRNNIFANKITTSATSNVEIVAIRFPPSYSFANNIINNNAYFVPPTAGYFMGKIGNTVGTGNILNLAALQDITGLDTSSLPATNQNAPFTSDAVLTIPTNTITGMESGGVLISSLGINNDYTNAVRPLTPGTLPDIGAYEFNGIYADLLPPVITYTPLIGLCTAGARTLTATITDISGVPTTGAGLPVLYWKSNAGPYTAAVGTFGVGGYSFTFGAGTVAGDVLSYYIVARDNAPSNNIGTFPKTGAGGFTVSPLAASTPPTKPSSYMNFVPLGGIYTVGAMGAYPTITAAVNAYNNSCMTGAVIFSLIDATYPTETFPITIIANATSNATNTLTIKPAAGVSPVITVTTEVVGFRLSGADFVTIDGSNGAGNTRNLTITTNAIATVGSISANVVVASTPTDGATNNTIKNCIIAGGNSSALVGNIIAGGSMILGNPAEVANTNLTISNNVLSRARTGIFVTGSLTYDSGWVITDNIISNVVDGINVRVAKNFIVANNTITDININTNDSNFGICVISSMSNSVCNISGNIIRNVKNGRTTDGGASGIFLSTGASLTNTVNIFNNVISDIASSGSIGGSYADNGYGIMINTGSGINIYHNTINMNTNQINAVGNPAAINIAAGVTNLNIRNNIFANPQTIGNPYAIYSSAPSSAFTSINNNNYYSAGANIGFLGTARTNLAAWQTATGQDAASVAINPAFISATNLTPSTLALDNKGLPITSVPLDITGATRNTTTPDVGAFEFVGLTCVTLANGTNTVPVGVVGVPYTFSVAVTPITAVVAYTLAVASPALPLGLSLDLTTGLISGTPTTITPTTGISCIINAVQSAPIGCVAITRTVTIIVNAPPCPIFTVSTAIPNIATVGVVYSLNAAATATFGTLSYTVSPFLPAGLGLDATTGLISGVPTFATASAIYVVRSRTSTACFADKSFTIVVNAVAPICPIFTVSTAVPTIATVGSNYNLNAGATATFGTLLYSVSPTLPAGLALNAITGLISGVPTAITASTNYVVTARTSTVCSVDKTFTFAVVAAPQDPATAIDNSLSNLVKISPNPSTKDFNVDFGGINMTKSVVRVYDTQGTILFTSYNNSNLKTISLDKLPSGIYLMEVETLKGKIFKRLAKQ